MPVPSAPPLRVFISHSLDDRRWAEWIAWQLEAGGHRAVLPAWDYVPGTKLADFVDAQTATADLVLALLSPTYASSVLPAVRLLSA